MQVIPFLCVFILDGALFGDDVNKILDRKQEAVGQSRGLCRLILCTNDQYDSTTFTLCYSLDRTSILLA